MHWSRLAVSICNLTSRVGRGSVLVVRPALHKLKSIVHLILLFASVCGACADDEKTKPMATPAEKLIILQQEYKEAQAEYAKTTQFLPGPLEANPKWQELSKRFVKQQDDLFMVAVELAKANPKSQIGFAALEWLLEIPSAYYFPAEASALELMSRQYAANPKIGRGIAVLAYYFDWTSTNFPSYHSAVDLLNAVADKNPDRTARGQAALGLAWLAKRQFELAESEANPDADRLAVKAVMAFEVVLRNYGDCPFLITIGVRSSTRTLGGKAESGLYELRHLRVGQVAPRIEGEDLDGARLKLSDYRGKVVLLVFWASWCGPCMADVPHEKALVDHFKGRPFVVVGVNGDYSKLEATKAVAEHEIPWRSYWDGEKGPGGPIALTWDVQGWPTIYVLDDQGVIQYKDLRGKRLDTPLEKLVSAAEKQ
jgi:thiol-disulfide isomerase/thioredoxin